MSGQLGFRWLQLPVFQQENHKQGVITAAVKCSAWHCQPESRRSCNSWTASWELLLLLMLCHLRSNKFQTNSSGLSSLLSKINGKIDFPWAKCNPGGFKPFKLICLIPDGMKPSGYTRVTKEATDNYLISCPYSQNHLSNYYIAFWSP